MARERGIGDGLRQGALSATTLKVVAAIEPGLAERLATDLVASGYRVTPIRADALPSDAALVLVRPASDRALEVLRRGPLELNLSTYQATVSGRRLDLTYMEYSLLRYLAASPGRVHARTALLADVWGYGSFGGVRTVDVHVRRLRAKLGEEHARLIETVRRVGYRFSTEPAS